jgi:DNA-binding NtrC family response regulator
MTHKPGWNYRILVVDDEPEIHRDFNEILAASPSGASDAFSGAFGGEPTPDFLPPFELSHANDGDEALRLVEGAREAGAPFALAFMDIRMPPGIDGVETMSRARRIDRDIEVVIMTAYTDKELAEIAGATDQVSKLLYLRKPFIREVVQQMALSLSAKWNVEREMVEGRNRLGAVLDATGDGMCLWDTEGRVSHTNAQYRRMFGLPDVDLTGLSFEELHGAMTARVREHDAFLEGEQALVPGAGAEPEDIVELLSPEVRMLYRSAVPVQGADGQPIGRLAVYRDVSKDLAVEQLQAEVVRARSQFEEAHGFENLVGRSEPMQALYTEIRQAAPGGISVLLLGESGVGKEMVAKALHAESPRAPGPFVAVNCAAIPESLIESELFGHEKGAFTGPTARRAGKFEQADGGTIFLDEVGEMDPGSQTKLLRVLQEREIQRVGGTADIPVDVRVVAATNADLDARVGEGRFREDLFYRIAGFAIRIPPLHERGEDIALLARHYLDCFAAEGSRPARDISAKTLQLLLNYNWPGNVRELVNVIERAALVEEGASLQPASLPPAILDYYGSRAPTPTRSMDASEEIETLDSLEKRAVSHAMRVTGRNIRQASRLLGIDRTTLYRKLRKHDVPR